MHTLNLATKVVGGLAKQKQFFGWCLPLDLWVKINSDDASKENMEMMGYGGLIRNEGGTCFWGL